MTLKVKKKVKENRVLIIDPNIHFSQFSYHLNLRFGSLISPIIFSFFCQGKKTQESRFDRKYLG